MCQKRNLKKLALNLSIQVKEGDTKVNNNNFYPHGPACILPNLFLGAYSNAIHREQLRQDKIDCIINVASEIPYTPIEHIQYHHIQWTHCQKNLARSGFDQAIQTIRAAHAQNKVVLVHCQQGIERSAALVLAFLLHSTRSFDGYLAGQAWSLDRAFQYVKERAPAIQPNMELMYQLREYEQSIQPKRNHTIQTRTRRSESVACGSPSRTLTTKKLQSRLQRSHSFRELSFIDRERTLVDKQVLAIASLLVVLSAIHQYNSHSCHFNQYHNKPTYIKTVYT